MLGRVSVHVLGKWWQRSNYEYVQNMGSLGQFGAVLGTFILLVPSQRILWRYENEVRTVRFPFWVYTCIRTLGTCSIQL